MTRSANGHFLVLHLVRPARSTDHVLSEPQSHTKCKPEGIADISDIIQSDKLGVCQNHSNVAVSQHTMNVPKLAQNISLSHEMYILVLKWILKMSMCSDLLAPLHYIQYTQMQIGSSQLICRSKLHHETNTTALKSHGLLLFAHLHISK